MADQTKTYGVQLWGREGGSWPDIFYIEADAVEHEGSNRYKFLRNGEVVARTHYPVAAWWIVPDRAQPFHVDDDG